MASAVILVVEDERITAEDIRAGLKLDGYHVPLVVSSGEEAVQQAGKIRPDLVLMDIKLEGEMDGIDAACEIRKLYDIPVIYLTAYSDEKTVQRAKMTEPSGFLVKGQGIINKPFEESELHAAIEITLYRHQMEKEHDQLCTTMLQNISEAVIATNSEGKIKFINVVAESLTGWSKDDALGKNLAEVFLPLNEVYEEVTIDSASSSTETPTITTLNGSKLMVRGKVTPIKDYKEDINGLIVVFQASDQQK
jgi:two-component system, response regulator PdtaR